VKGRGIPKGFDPAATHDPLAGFGGDALLYLRLQIAKAVGPLEIKAELTHANAQEVVGRVGKAGQDRSAFEV